MAVTVAMKMNKPKDAAPVKSSSKAKKSVGMTSSTSRPKYSQMILQAVINTKGQGKMNVSRPDIVKYVVANYNLDPAAASRHINVNLKKMVESGELKPAAAAGRKGAGSFRLGQVVKEKTTGKPRKATAAKKTTAAKTKGNKGGKPKSVAAGKSKVNSAKPKKAPKVVKPKK